jgi:peptidyl-prolyl cis-trans isomerase C
MIRLKPLLAITAVAVLAACAQKNTGTDAKQESVATVDGHPVSRNTFEQYAKGVAGKPAEDLTAEQRSTLLDAIIASEVVAQQAERDGTAAKDEVRAALDLARLQILQRASQQAYLKDRQPSEEELRAEYDIQVSQLGKTEYRLSQILVATEDAAKKIIAQLKSGANFAQLAKTQSTDSNSRDKGGDLDWNTITGGPFADVVGKLKKGEVAPEPVKTQFGYHVIRLTDTRDVTPPPYDSVKDRLVQLVEQKKFKAYADSLQAKAKIEKTLK